MTALAGPGGASDYKYWAFISYSHRDERWARWLHRALETYRIPKQLAQRSAATGVEPPKRIYPVFLDRDELSGGFDLSERITSALAQSRFLIVICSPHAVASRHVQEEIDVFENLGREQRVLCLIVDGEPGASGRPESGLQECLPIPVRTRRTAEGELVPCEPLAADVRKGKDGRNNAKLKILAEVLGVNFDELKQRDERRRLQRRLQVAAAVAGISVLGTTGYVVALDAGLNAPGGTITRRFADRHGLSILRRIPSQAVVRQQARALRNRLSSRLLAARRGTWFVSRFKPKDSHDRVWSHSQISFVLLDDPDADTRRLQDVAASLENPFASELKIERNGEHFGWLARPDEVSPLSPPALWTALALAAAVGRDAYPTQAAKDRAAMRLAYVQDTLHHYQPHGTAGWNFFPRQQVAEQHNVYAATLALMALLEVKRANLPWQGTIEERDRLIRQTFDWLIGQFDPHGSPPGWQAGDDGVNVTFDGLTLQIYGRLLDARSTAGLTIPPEITRAIVPHLTGIAERKLDFLKNTAEFYVTVVLDGKPVKARESVNFPWYPWAVDCAVRWLRSEDALNAAPEDRVAVERTLSHLVMTLGDEATTNALADDSTFGAAEMLYGLSGVVDAPSK